MIVWDRPEVSKGLAFLNSDGEYDASRKWSGKTVLMAPPKRDFGALL